ncbi:uncharacterized protein LOC117786824 [Drosophila innubila]|uniref:uncharacterized protein LOC117786824 n=1 Tax=Drosophila innubila TaxID=198719 RepID=UPI00148BBBBE|nr:uncharacterized protein LOC117786824 [Drosophila innubila]
MGGTRCVFRDCQVSTQRNPKMHFFKLPVRDPARLEAWLKNCGNADILNVAREKLSNRAVCARHFRHECFMNYKLDRLVPNQIPTLARISKELAWDLGHLDENGEATMVKLTNPTLTHLIPPADFECPLGFTEDARFGRKYAARSRTPPRPLELDEIKRQKIVHAHDEEPMKRIELVEVIEDEKSAEEELVKATKTIIDRMEQDAPVIPETSGPTLSDQILEELQLKYDQLKANFDQLSAENVALKETAVKLEAQQQACEVNPSSSSAPAPQLTKTQLYKGIKKYLGPSMAALVRMEMFGGGEREWKEDERDFAMELLQLGEGVYNHSLDEWRFRLPSLRLTRSWLQNTRSADNEDENL